MRLAMAVLTLAIVWAGPATAAEFTQIPSVAVLYFDNATGADHLSWLPKGFADLLIRDLASTGRIKVPSRREIDHAQTTYRGLNSTAFANKVIALRMAKILNVPYLIAGRFVRRDTDLIVELKLYDVKQQRQTAWRQVEGPADGFAFLEKQAALKIIELLGVRLTDREMIELMQIPTRDIKALAYYSMGLDALDHDDREQARALFQTSMDADRYFRLAASAISGMAFVLSGKAVLRAAISETSTIGASTLQSVQDILDLAVTNAFDYVMGDPVTSPNDDDSTRINVSVPLQFTVRPDYVNLWLYAIRRMGKDTTATVPVSKLSFVRPDLFDNPVALSVPSSVAAEWLNGWKSLRMRLVFQNRDGAVLFESPKAPVLPLYVGDADGLFDGVPSVYWKLDTSFEIDRVPKQFFEEPLEVSFEVDR